MSRHRVLPALVAGAALVAITATFPAAAQGTKDPFGDLDLNSLLKKGGDQSAPAPSPQPPTTQQRRPTDPYLGHRGDPIGSLNRTATFDRRNKIYVGKSSTGTVACYYREQGDSHRLDIGIAAQGAFARLQTPEPREVTPTSPLRIFAGKEKTRRSGGNEYATGEYTVLKAYDGPVEFYAPKPTAGDFTAIGKSDPAGFLAMVAAARREFVVVQSTGGAKAANIVAVYRFNAAMIPALLACAKAQHIAVVAAAPVSTAAEPQAGGEGWAVYKNARFGTTIDYPTGIFTVREQPPENGDGQTFRSADGRAQLLVYGTHNAENDSPQSYVAKYIDGKGISFRRVTANFFAVSGLSDGEIFYQRCNFPPPGGDIVECFKVSYPASEKAAWNGIVGRLSRSLRAGQAVE